MPLADQTQGQDLDLNDWAHPTREMPTVNKNRQQGAPAPIDRTRPRRVMPLADQTQGQDLDLNDWAQPTVNKNRPTPRKKMDHDQSEINSEINETAATKRNEIRVHDSNKQDEKLICKYAYLPTVPNIFQTTIHGPDDIKTPPDWLVKNLLHVVRKIVPPPQRPPISFGTDQASLDANDSLLQSFDFDLQKLIETNRHTSLDYGSEFRQIEDLRSILGQHPNFAFFESVYRNGMNYTFTRELSDTERATELQANLSRGNHKSAQENSSEVRRLLAKDVTHGFSLPVNVATVQKLDHAMVQPCGLAQQFTLTETGARVPKLRLTQDLSFAITANDVSVNNRIDMDEYPEMIYGWCLNRLIHFVTALQLKFPSERILTAKYDFSDAYRRVAHSASAAVQSIIVLDEVAYIALRLSFGGSPNPPSWCCFSEMVTDLSNELPRCKNWDPTILHSPIQPTVPPPVYKTDDDEPIGQARALSVHIPTSDLGRADCFIDDIIKVMLDRPDNILRHATATPLAVFACARPHAGEQEPIPRRENLSPSKLEAEGTPAEVQIVLGWELDTRALTLRLPFDKYTAWLEDIHTLLLTTTTTLKHLESIIGRLNHVAYVIPLSRHFLSRLRHRLHSIGSQRQLFRLSLEELEDLKLWLHFLQRARDGMSLNNLTLRKPTQIAISDSCPYGLGGFISFGRAWRLRIPTTSRLDDTANNFLELLAMVVTIWLAIQECDKRGLIHEHILGLGDNTSAIGWLYKTSGVKSDTIYDRPVRFVSRHLAKIITNSAHSLTSQHCPGKKNTISDLLSFQANDRNNSEYGGSSHPLTPDFPSNSVLTQRFHTFLPQLIPENFEISQLPADIASFVTDAMQIAESSWMRYKNRQTKTSTESGDGGSTSAKQKSEFSTHASMTFPQTKPSSYFVPSSHAIAELNSNQTEHFVDGVTAPWLQRLSVVPQALWLRRSGTVSGGRPFTSRTQKTTSHHCADFSKPLASSLHHRNANEQSHKSYSDNSNTSAVTSTTRQTKPSTSSLEPSSSPCELANTSKPR